MSLFAAVQPLVMTHQGYQVAYGEDDPEEQAIMQVNDRALASAITEVLSDLYGIDLDLTRPRDEEGPAEEIGEVEDLHRLRAIAAQVHGKTPDDYQEGRVPVGFQFNHLINHSDSDGFYLPVDFMQTFFIEEVSIGSSVGLLSELDALEPVLAGEFPDDMARAIGTPIDEVVAVRGVVGLWERLRRLCRASVEMDLPVHFG